jgi:hypothetical protein
MTNSKMNTLTEGVVNQNSEIARTRQTNGTLKSTEPRIYLDSNGITIKCEKNCPVGYKETVNEYFGI